MKTALLLTLTVLILTAGIMCSSCTQGGKSSLDITENAQGFQVNENGEPVLFYQKTAKDKDGEYSRANYVHPLHDLDGYSLTEDFPADHLHHRGIFWAWHQLYVGEQAVGDGWSIKDTEWDVVDVKPAADGTKSVSLKTHVLWKSPLWTDDQGNLKPLVDETAVITVHKSEPERRVVDFEIGLLALEPNMRIGGSNDDKGYSGFSVRIKLPEDLVFLSREGVVKPVRNQIEAGPWLDFSGSINGAARNGLAVFCHPSSPDYPQPWILRAQHSMQNPVYPGSRAVPMSDKERLVFRYRLVVHQGMGNTEQIDRWFAEYAKMF